MQCETIYDLMPGSGGVVSDLPFDAANHVSSCLRCQAEAAHYRKLKSSLSNLKTQYVQPDPQLVNQIMFSVRNRSNVVPIRASKSSRLKSRPAVAAAITAGAGAAIMAFKFVNKHRLAS